MAGLSLLLTRGLTTSHRISLLVLTLPGGTRPESAVSRRSLAEAELASNQARLTAWCPSPSRPLGLDGGDRVPTTRCAEPPPHAAGADPQAWMTRSIGDRAHVAAALEALEAGACFETDYRINR
jgi:hypothetical protein